MVVLHGGLVIVDHRQGVLHSHQVVVGPAHMPIVVNSLRRMRGHMTHEGACLVMDGHQVVIGPARMPVVMDSL